VLGWDKDAPFGHFLQCKSLKQVLHIYLGMLDYCLKDSHESHFQFVERDVNVDEKNACKLEHAKHGVVVFKNHVLLSHNSVIEHVHMHGKI
jgi:hypothetical protein